MIRGNDVRSLSYVPRLPALRNLRFFLIALAATTAASCESCQGGRRGSSSGLSSGGGGWLVGQSALMINVPHDPEGDVGHYRLDVREDLLGIACRGTTDAWVVGERGLMLATRDAGSTWQVMDSGVTTTLRAVALGAPDAIYVAGDGGVARASFDGGRSWRPLVTPALPWTSVSTRKSDGGLALLASSTGAIYRYEAGSGWLGEVGSSTGGGLFSVVLGRNGQTAVAVGEAGTMMVSADGGRSWRARATGSSATLRDVWLTGDQSDRFVAVGDGGLLLEGAVFGTGTESRNLGAESTLRALHLEATGHGTIVGDRGAVFLTDDFGSTWNRLELDDPRNIFGVDALDSGGHL
jgi:photosystem II stability/assembly factor-like uncharacterized protein